MHGPAVYLCYYDFPEALAPVLKVSLLAEFKQAHSLLSWPAPQQTVLFFCTLLQIHYFTNTCLNCKSTFGRSWSNNSIIILCGPAVTGRIPMSTAQNNYVNIHMQGHTCSHTQSYTLHIGDHSSLNIPDN